MFRFKRSRALTSIALLPLFVSSFLSFPALLQAAPIAVSPAGSISSMNSLASSLAIPKMPQDLIRIEKQLNGAATKLVLDAENVDRVYLLSETSHGQTLTLRYVYDDALCTVTLLFSQVPEGQAPLFTQYYRYASGPNDSLELIFEEGWVKENTLTPSRIYDYFAGAVKIRSFDRTGKILRIESSEGSKRILVYSREGKLLTIQDVDLSGQVLFYDQISNSRSLELPAPFSDQRNLLFVLPDRGKEKLFASISHSRAGGNPADPRLREDDNQNRSHHFLLWLEAAHPMRAGPAGGLL